MLSYSDFRNIYSDFKNNRKMVVIYFVIFCFITFVIWAAPKVLILVQDKEIMTAQECWKRYGENPDGKLLFDCLKRDAGWE